MSTVSEKKEKSVNLEPAEKFVTKRHIEVLLELEQDPVGEMD